MTVANEVARVAIIGGGPGGLFTAYLLQNRFLAPVDVTIFEAGNRLGGKIVTRQFRAEPINYEAGAAELYDYSAVGPDPLRELVDELGLKTHQMSGHAVFIGNDLLRTDSDLARWAGEEALTEYRSFISKAATLIDPAAYYESDWQADNGDPLARQTFDTLLNQLKHPRVRAYIEAAIHSDLATEPRHTSAMYGLQNLLMNEPGYMRLYGIDGGIERLPEAVARRIDARIKLNCPVLALQSIEEDSYRVEWRERGRTVSGEFDFVVVALPNGWIPAIDFQDANLAAAMSAHHAHYDHPAHYLRVSVLFREPFWRKTVADSYFMSDAFGGCCVYDESARTTPTAAGVLGWLIGGEAALMLNNLDDDVLIDRVLDSLPAPLRHGRELAVEGRVHRWTGAVNAMPGGYPLREPDSRHVPDPINHPTLFVVGDYLFDSTLNGVLDSAECVAEWITEELTNDTPSIGISQPGRTASSV